MFKVLADLLCPKAGLIQCTFRREQLLDHRPQLGDLGLCTVYPVIQSFTDDDHSLLIGMSIHVEPIERIRKGRAELQ